MEAFLRTIDPPLQQLDVALSAIPSSGVTVAHLRRVAGREAPVEKFANLLRITLPADRVMFHAFVEDLLKAPAVGGAPAAA